MAIGTKTGYRLFSLHSVDSLDPIYNTSKYTRELDLCEKYYIHFIFMDTMEILNDVFCLAAEFDEIHIVERLFSSSLVAIVGLSSPRKLRICHFKKGTEICNYSYSNSILSVKLNRMVSRRCGCLCSMMKLVISCVSFEIC